MVNITRTHTSREFHQLEILEILDWNNSHAARHEGQRQTSGVSHYNHQVPTHSLALLLSILKILPHACINGQEKQHSQKAVFFLILGFLHGVRGEFTVVWKTDVEIRIVTHDH